MKWGRAWLVVLAFLIILFVWAFYSGAFMHGDM